MARRVLLLAIALLLFTTGAAMAEKISGNITEGGWIDVGYDSHTFAALIKLDKPLDDYAGVWGIAVTAKQIYDDGNLCNNVEISQEGTLVPIDSSNTTFRVRWSEWLCPNWDSPSGIALPPNITRQIVSVNVVY